MDIISSSKKFRPLVVKVAHTLKFTKKQIAISKSIEIRFVLLLYNRFLLFGGQRPPKDPQKGQKAPIGPK